MTPKAAYPDNLSTLTSLRFFAAFWVVLFHFATILPDGGLKDAAFPSKGYLAVDFFFILSGFILSHVYSAKFKNRKIPKTDFYIKRIARIYPLHIFTLFVYVCAILILKLWGGHYIDSSDLSSYLDYFAWHSIVTNITMTHAWGFEQIQTFNRPSWSISAEWFAYLLFPFMVLFYQKIDAIKLLISGLLFLAALWFLCPALGLRPLTHLTVDFSILRILPEFLVGMGIYAVSTKCRVPLKTGWLLWPSLFLVIIAANYSISDIYIVILFALTIFVASEGDRQGRRSILNNRVFIYLGNISYSIYMVHFLVLDAMYVFYFSKIGGENANLELLVFAWIAMFPLTIILSAIMYHMIERPAQSLIINKFINRTTEENKHEKDTKKSNNL